MKPTGSLKLIREINSSIILDLLKEKAPLSKFDLSKTSGLSAPTIKKVINDLIEIGIVKEIGIGESIGGRPPLLLDLNHEGCFVIGVDIGSDDITSIVVDFLGRIISKSVSPMNVEDSDFVIFDKIISTISDSIKNSGKNWSSFFGMGIGISGDIDSELGIINHASRLNWNNVPLKSILEKSFNIPTFIDENVRLLSFGEYWFGAGKNYKNIVCIRVGDDIGAGILINGELYNGSTGKAGINIGHMIIKADGLKCECGASGCLQTLISSNAIIARTEQLLKEQNNSILLTHANDIPTQLSVKAIAEAAKSGDAVSLRVMEETGKYLAIAISNIINSFDPELVIIGGGIAQSGEVLFAPLMENLQKHIGSLNTSVKVVQSILGNNAYAIGAATVVLHQIFSSPKKFVYRRNL